MRAQTCFGVASLVGDAPDGLQEALFAPVGAQLELRQRLVAELDDGDLSHDTRSEDGGVKGQARPPTGVPGPRGYLRPVGPDPVQGPGGAGQEADDLQEVVVPDAPGAVHQEDQVRSGCPATWTGRGREAAVNTSQLFAGGVPRIQRHSCLPRADARIPGGVRARPRMCGDTSPRRQQEAQKTT